MVLQTESFLQGISLLAADFDNHIARVREVQGQLQSLCDHLASDDNNEETYNLWNGIFMTLLQHLIEKRDEIISISTLPANLLDTIAPLEIQLSTSQAAIGAPKILIDTDQVHKACLDGYKLAELADMAKISPSTLYRRRHEHREEYTISDDDLDCQIQQILGRVPNMGRIMIRGALRSRNINVTIARIRKSMQRVDPTRSLLRATASTIPRIPYIVGCPNEIWHFDGNHKLINWGFIVSAAMDGATKRLPWVRVTSNNYATTVLEFFEDAMQELGIPQRVRSDKGGENILVLQKMFELRPDADCPAIAGKSTRNTRIE